MPRRPREFHAGATLHVVRRAHNRQTCFTDATDYGLYIALLTEFAPASGCEVHAYALMRNHVHLLLTPKDAAGPATLMKQVDQRYSQSFNRSRNRTGTLWEGRYHASMVDSDAYVLACYRYIELNPVRAGIASHPGEYRWTSHRANLGLERSPLLVPHVSFLALATPNRDAAAVYRELFDQPLDPTVVAAIRNARTASPVPDRGLTRV